MSLAIKDTLTWERYWQCWQALVEMEDRYEHALREIRRFRSGDSPDEIRREVECEIADKRDRMNIAIRRIRLRV